MCLDNLQCSDCPREWAHQEQIMNAATKGKSNVIIGDDKNPGRCWVAKYGELAVNLLQQVNNDPHWTMMPNLSTSFVKMIYVAVSMLALPSWLRKRTRPLDETEPPFVVP